MKSKKNMLLFFLAIGIAAIGRANPLEDGKSIFMTRCAACHNVNKVLTGPALAGIEEKRSLDWIFKFVHSSQSLVKSGDKEAIEIFEQFNKIPMPDHPDLTEENIKNILAYIKSETKTGEASVAPFPKPGKKPSNAKPLSADNYGFFAAYFFSVAALISALLFAVRIKSYERNKEEEKLSAS